MIDLKENYLKEAKDFVSKNKDAIFNELCNHGELSHEFIKHICQPVKRQTRRIIELFLFMVISELFSIEELNTKKHKKEFLKELDALYFWKYLQCFELNSIMKIFSYKTCFNLDTNKNLMENLLIIDKEAS